MKKRVAVAMLGLAGLLGACGAPALASCGDRPGTPTDIRVQGKEGGITILWRDTTKPGEGSCHDIEIKRSSNGDTSKSVGGGVCLPGGTQGSLVVDGLPYGETFCVRMKARDHAGTQGCTSEQWSATVCGFAQYPPGGIGGKGGTTPSGPAIAAVEPGVDRPGSDIPGARFTPARADYQECSRACSNNRSCAAWTYVKPGVQGPSAVCYLKSSVPPPRNSDCCTSGGPQLIVK